MHGLSAQDLPEGWGDAYCTADRLISIVAHMDVSRNHRDVIEMLRERRCEAEELIILEDAIERLRLLNEEDEARYAAWKRRDGPGRRDLDEVKQLVDGSVTVVRDILDQLIRELECWSSHAPALGLAIRARREAAYLPVGARAASDE